MALDYLPSPGWAVIYGETPSATRWSELGDNDDALATGAGIDDAAILTRHLATDAVTPIKLSNPYKFSAYPSSTVGISSATQKIALNTESFDTNNNFDTATYRYTAPVTGYYQINALARLGSAGMGTTENASLGLYKNGAQIAISDKINGSGDAGRIATPNISKLVPLTAGDYLELYALMGGVYRDIVAGPVVTYMDGWLVEQT